jgi:Fe-S-cluster containining protein
MASAPPGAVMYAVELKTAHGVLRGRVAVDPGPMRLADLVPSALEITELLVSQANRREEQAGRHISCCAGCGACCRQMVPLSPPEALYLSQVLDALPDTRRRAVLERFARIDRELEERGLIDELFDPHYSDEPMLKIARAYFQLQLPCPFLVDEACSIHALRPVACREYNVTSKAAYCADPSVYPIEKVPMPLPLSAPLARLTAELTGTKPRLIPLTLVPRWLSSQRELAERTWPGIELFGHFMEQLNGGASDRARLGDPP